MPDPAPHFHRFLRALHRRLVVVRTLERAGVGALTGCAAAGILIPLLLWRGESALTPALFLLGLGAVAGLMWGLAHRPTPLAAAMEADRQLGLADLLGTAASCGAPGDDPWCRTVLAVADDRCRRHAPAQVLLNRLGQRAWGGIGLAAALVLTLSAMTGNPREVRAVASRGEGGAAHRGPAAPSATERHIEVSGAQGRRPVSAGSPDPESRASDPGDATLRRAEPGGAAGEKVAEGAGRSSAGDSGRGGGTGRARDPLTPPDRSHEAINSGPRAATPDRGGRPSAGPGAASSQATSSAAGPAGGNVQTAPGPSPRTPPWRTDEWPADVRAAQEALDAGTVPDASRDLVRDYFDRF